MNKQPLELTRWIRFFRRPDGARLAESMLRELCVEIDPATEAVLRRLRLGGTRESVLRGAGVPRAEARLRLEVLEQAGLVVQESDAGAWAAAFEASRAELPLIDQVEVTNHCPMKCVMCERGVRGTGRPQGFIDAAFFARLVRDIAARGPMPKPLTLHSWGESLLHPELPALVRSATEAGVPTELSVNPGLLTLSRYRALRDAGLVRLTLSIDGVSRGTLEAVRGPAARGDRALAHVEAILEERRRTGETSPQLVLQMIRLGLNAHEHEEFLARFGDLGLPGVVAFLKPLDAGSDPSVFPSGFVPRPELCRTPWKSVVVLWDGRVTTCCHDCEGRNVLGDLGQASLEQLWTGRRLAGLRRRLVEGRTTAKDACHRCAHRPDRYVPNTLEECPVDPFAW